MRIAVIDIGTNSLHMMMVDIQPSFTFEVIGREKEMVRLGDGTLSSGRLSEAVMERGMAAIKKFYHLAQSKGIQKIFAVATSAVREAENGGDFIQRIQKETAIKARVITGEEEGRLIYLGVRHSLDLPAGHSLLIDIGGGSVEILVATPERILFLKSLKLGVARLKDLFLRKGSAKELAKLEEHVARALRKVAKEVKALGFDHAIGTSGTFNTLASMAQWLTCKEGETAPQPLSLSAQALKLLYKEIAQNAPEERMRMKGLDEKRADLILSGAAVASAILKALGVEKLEVCDKAIRDGMVYDYIDRNQRKIKSEGEIPDLRRRHVMRLALKCKFDRQHAERVAALVLQLFDQTSHSHRLGGEDRELLEYSAILHDIGYHIGYDKHHRHAYYLIKNVSMNGFSQEEIETMALVARYHRRSGPKKSHGEFSSLSKDQRQRVKWMAGLLRVADAMDRSHFSVVDALKLRKEGKKLAIYVRAHSDPEYEIWDAKRKCDLLSELCGREIVFRFKKIKKARKRAA